ncbi:MAG TPA: DUF1611 domain-containing protein [Natrialbaceae archaeon]|nr:DUF1611 domain-containing protein [Natrialbaceae archaeon]
MRVAILAHEKFPGRAKTAIGILRYAEYDVAAVLDRDAAGTRVRDHIADAQDAPIVESMDEVEGPIDALIIGISPIGGDFDDSWRPDVRAAIGRGCDVYSGLHYFLSEDEEFAALAEEHDVDLWDVRDPPDDLDVSKGVAADVDAEIVLTVGTDCASGKMTVTMELVEALNEAGHDAAAIPTGQTGIMIEDWGIPIDRTISDFTAGAVERMILEKGDDHAYLVVEGQGSIVHPAYSAVTCGILHGSMADQIVLCHEAGREAIHGYEDFELPPISEYVDLYEDLAAPVHETEMVAGALNTRELDDDETAREVVEEFAGDLGAPAIDPIRFDSKPLVEAITEQ